MDAVELWKMAGEVVGWCRLDVDFPCDRCIGLGVVDFENGRYAQRHC